MDNDQQITASPRTLTANELHRFRPVRNLSGRPGGFT